MATPPEFRYTVPMFINTLFTDPQYFIWVVLVGLFSVSLHEFFHAWAAYLEGDDTAKQRGYFTLNPLVHMGPVSILMLAMFGLCWGACPVNPRNLRRRYSHALVAFAGPFANLLLMVAFAAGYALFFYLPVAMTSTLTGNLQEFFLVGGVFNAALFLLNMIPLPPLDGHSIVADFFPATRRFYSNLGAGGFVLLILLFWLPFGFGERFWDLARVMSFGCIQIFGAWAYP